MKRNLERYLVRKFPLCFGDYGKSPKENLMAFGLEVGDGWYKIIKTACEKAEPIIAKWIEEHKHEKDYKNWAPKFAQVKEKLGSLRLYFTTYPDGIEAIEREAEEKSETTCETCGAYGEIRGESWLYCACYQHSKPEDRKNLEYLEMKYKEQKQNGKTRSKLHHKTK